VWGAAHWKLCGLVEIVDKMIVDRWTAVLCVCLVSLAVSQDSTITKSLKETDDAYVLDAELPDKTTKTTKGKTSTRLLGLSSGNTAIDGAVVGLGVGVIGSLLVGKLLEEKNKCNPRGRRDTTQTRFLPGLFGGNNNNKCPPPPYNSGHNQQHSGYQQNAGYQQPNSGYRQPNSGYQQPNSGYQQTNSGYRPTNSGYQQPNSGYQQPNSGYRQPNAGYQQAHSGYRPSNSGYQQPNSGYQQPNSGYHQSNSGYPQLNSGYQRPNSGYQRPNSGYQPSRNQQSGFSQTNTHKATAAPFSSGIHSGNQQSGYQPPSPGYNHQQSFPGIRGRSLPKEEKSKVNFGK